MINQELINLLQTLPPDLEVGYERPFGDEMGMAIVKTATVCETVYPNDDGTENPGLPVILLDM